MSYWQTAWLAVLAALPAIGAIRDYTVGAYRIHTELTPQGLSLSYQPYEKYRHFAWAETRYHPTADPTGPRPYWDLPLAEILSGWRDNPDLATSAVFRLELAATGEGHWARLDLADALVRDFLMRYPIARFADAHRAALESLAARQRSELGPPIVFADFGTADGARRDQYLLKEALASLAGGSTYFSAEEGRLDSPEQAAALAPRLEKLSVTPVALSAPTLIVVHATSEFDEQQRAKAGIDRLIARFKARHQPVVFLMNDSGDGDLGWYTADRRPDFAVFSQGGEHNLDLRTADITLAGGFFGDYDGAHGCQFKAMADAITRYFLKGHGVLRIHLPVTALYFYADDQPVVDDFLAGRSTAEKFIDYVRDLLLFTEDDRHLGMSLAETGSLSTTDYRFDFFLGDRRLGTRGSGTKVVELRFTRDP